MRRTAGLLAGIVLVTVTTSALADNAACVKASERGQVARREGKLREARRQFLACTTDCPTVITNDCATWAEQVLSALPTIVVDAQDEAGHDVGDATLAIDGEVITHQLDGKAIPVDPGSHTLTLQRNPPLRSSAIQPKVTETIIAKEGAKARPVRMTISSAVVATEPSPRTASPTAAPEASPPGGGGHTIYPWILVGVGAVVASVGILLVATAPELPSNCSADTGKCAPEPGREAEVERDRDQAGRATEQPALGLITMVGGGALILGGLVWHFLEPTKSRNAMLAPWLLAGSGGFVARQIF